MAAQIAEGIKDAELRHAFLAHPLVARVREASGPAGAGSAA
jgi:hypothetical protein